MSVIPLKHFLLVEERRALFAILGEALDFDSFGVTSVDISLNDDCENNDDQNESHFTLKDAVVVLYRVYELNLIN